MSAIEWLVARGYPVWLPLGHSPDVDLVTRISGRLVGVQVKTSSVLRKAAGTSRCARAAAIRAGAGS